jgi:hypothetical protein
VTEAAADGARRYLTRPNIFNLHGVTGAMAIELLVAHIPPDAGAAALAQVRAEHAALYARIPPTPADPTSAAHLGDDVVDAAVDSRDAHQVKLVEACRRGLAMTGDPSFAAAAETVTRHGGRLSARQDFDDRSGTALTS